MKSNFFFCSSSECAFASCYVYMNVKRGSSWNIENHKFAALSVANSILLLVAVTIFSSWNETTLSSERDEAIRGLEERIYKLESILQDLLDRLKDNFFADRLHLLLFLFFIFSSSNHPDARPEFSTGDEEHVSNADSGDAHEEIISSAEADQAAADHAELRPSHRLLKRDTDEDEGTSKATHEVTERTAIYASRSMTCS